MAKFTPSRTSTPDLNVDDGTLAVDESGNKVGIATESPSHPLTVAGDMSGSGKLFNVGGIETQGDLGVTGSLTVRNDIILDDGGSLKEGGGTAAITIDASGEITKIGQDTHTSGQFLQWDGSKAVWAAQSTGGEADSVAADNVSAGDDNISITGGSGHSLTLNATAAQAQLKTTTSGEVDITSAANIDINATTGIAVDATTVSIDGTDDSNITVTASAKDLDIAVAGGGTQELRLASAGTGGSALHLNASAGSVDIDSADNITVDAADEISITTTSADGHITLTSAHTAGVAFHVDANAHAESEVQIDAGLLDIDVTSAAELDAASLVVTSDTVTLTSANASDPLVQIKNTANDATGARLQFVKDRGANNGADGDDCGVIEFYGTDGGSNQTEFARIVAEVSESDNTDEAGKLTLYVAESDGTTTALAAGLVLEGEHATDGEVDVTIASGAASTTTVAGVLKVTGNVIQASDGGSTITMDTSDNVTIAGDVQVSGNNIKDGGGNSGITFDGSGNTAIDVDLTVTGGDITVGASGNTTATTISTVTNTGTNAGKALTISAGSTTTNGNNLAGGNLILKSGGGDGTGTSEVQIWTKTNGTDAATEKITIEADGSVASLIDGAALKFGADGEVTLTHVHNTGLLLSDDSGVGTTKLMFGDSACFIQQQGDGELGIDADSVINVTAPTVDIDATTAVTMTSPAVTIDSGADGKPVLTLKTTHTTKTSSGELQFLKDAADTEDGEVLGQITFYGEDEGNNNTQFAGIVASISESDEGDEAGTLEFKVAESDSTDTAMTTGLKLEGEHATDGEIDVTIGAGAASTTTIVGTSQFNGDATFGVDDTGVDVRIFSATASEGVLYDASEDELALLLTTKLKFHDVGGDEEIFASSDGHLEINSGATLDMTAPTVDINASTALTIDGPAVTVADSADGKPVLTLKTTHTTKTSSGELQFLKDAADTEDGEVLGQITFYGEDEGNNNTAFAKIVASISESDEGDEAGKLELFVAESDSTDTALTAGLTLEGEHATDGEIDVTIGAGTSSTTTVAGDLQINGDSRHMAAAPGAAGAYTQVVNRVTGATDNTATAVFTVTVPNGAHTAGIFLKVMGAVSDNEGVKIGQSSIAVSRVAGAATAKAVFSFGGSASFTLDSTASGGSEAASNIDITASSNSGGNTATQTFTVNVAVDTASGTTADIVAVADLLNNEASGITIAAA